MWERGSPLPTAASGLKVEPRLLSSPPSLLLPGVRAEAPFCSSDWGAPPHLKGGLDHLGLKA